MVDNTSSIPSHNAQDIRKMVFASLFAAMTAVGAYIKIPIPVGPVPLTLQVLFVLLAGIMLKSKWGAISMLIYVLLGIVGLPVFAGGASGPGVLFGPTGGYLVGFMAAAFVVGFAAEHKGTSNVLLNAVFMAAGLGVIYLFGVIQLAVVAKLTVMQAIAAGILPFLIGDFMTIIAGAYIASRYKI
ncbi:MAG TPA: biotin transporter BioY [Methanosarcinaceae archaeon]|nr:biotin transporter BioY [Methanosarcinaceae archaeon]